MPPFLVSNLFILLVILLLLILWNTPTNKPAKSKITPCPIAKENTKEYDPIHELWEARVSIAINGAEAHGEDIKP